MEKRLRFVLAVLLFTIFPISITFAADGHWVFDSYGERISPRDSMGKACNVVGLAKNNGSSMDISCTDVNGKPYGYHGHFRWQYVNLSGNLIPGQKVSFKGVVTNTSGKDSSWAGWITQGSTHPASGNPSIMGTQIAKKAGQSSSGEGTWTVPSGPTRPMPDGKPSRLKLTFILSSGGSAGVEKYFFYRWQPGKPSAGVGAKPLPSDPAGVMESPSMTTSPPQAKSPQRTEPSHPSAPSQTQPSVKPPRPVSKLFDSFNAGGVVNGPSNPTTFTVNRPSVITQIQTYHWNFGKGSPPGTLALRAQNGRIYGPWPAKGTPGQGGVPNAFWTVNPNITIPAGSYTVVDSNQATWSMNSASDNRGFAQILARPAD